MQSRAGPLDWAVFAAAVLISVFADRFLFGKSERISFREATIRSGLAVSTGVLFGGFVFYRLGSDTTVSYFTAFLVEESLSVDNLFVFLVIFTYFRIREGHQLRILVWGIFGAVVMRGIFIVAGSALLHQFHFTIYVFGAFLVYTGARLVFKKDEQVDPESNLALRFARKYLRTTSKYDGSKFFTTIDGVRYATPLFLVLIVIEFSDIVFAVDSVPAVLAISNDVFVVYTSNIFAILGLRALYFMLAGMMTRFRYLDIGLSIILVFIGVKMLISTIYKLSNVLSLAVIGSVLTISVLVSLLKPPRDLSSGDR